jgi:uncharacterized protein (DUF427 family)
MKFTVKSRKGGAVLAQGVENETVRQFEGNLYFAPEAVRAEHLVVTERIYTCPYKGVCYWVDLDSPDGRAQNVAWIYREPKPGYEFIKDQWGFYNRDTAGTESVREEA